MASKRIVMTVAVLLAVGLLVAGSGCGGVQLNAEYSQLLDQTAVLSAETARRAEAGGLTTEQMVAALRYQADCWASFRDGRDGVSRGGEGDH